MIHNLKSKDMNIKPKSVIRPKQKDYCDIIASFQI